MTQPRDVQDYEAQAREILAADDWKFHERIAAALRAAERSALERAAQLCQDDATYQERGDPRGMALSTAAQRIRALIAPASESSPAPDPIHEAYLAADEYGQPPSAEPQPPRWRIGRHYGIHVYRGETPIATFHTVDDAKAAVRAYNASLDAPARYVVPAPRLADAEKRIAELEAALAKAHDAIRWACGDEPLKDGRWFNCRAFGYEDNAAPRYWWRSILRLYSGLPDDPAPSKEPPP